MEDQNTTLKMVETKKKIAKTVNRKYSKTQIVEAPFFLDDGGFNFYFAKFIHYIIGFFRALWTVLYIIPAIVMGILEGLSQGMLKGLKKATESYEKQVGKS